MDISSDMDQREGGDISYLDMVEREVHDSPVKDFYEDSTIFVTGATGFMGKILIEKLLRTCPEVKKIIILARAKKGKEIEKRFEEQFSDPLYSKLKIQNPNFISKLSFVPGDVGFIKLGMSDKDYETICSEVNVIFHMAATVRFDEKIQTAVRVNVRGTREIMNLARDTPNLKAILHVSTAFSNCIINDIQEKFYDPPIPSDKLIDLVELLDEEMLNQITPTLLGKFPNTYAFTKVAAENVIKEMSKDLPVAVIRPSIIIPTAKEPITGWIDNVYGPTGVCVGAGLGLMHSLHCDPNALADVIPVDYIINACLVVTYEIGRIHDIPNAELVNSADRDPENSSKIVDHQVPIYNFVSSNQRPLTWKTYMYYNEKYGLEVPTLLSIWYYSFRLTKNYYLHMLFVLFTHLLPAYIFDGVSYCIGKKPKLVKAYEKIHKFSKVISYFTMQQWRFETRNTERLYASIAPGDRALFDFNIAHLNWEEYFYTHIRGLRVYLLKDPLDTLDTAKRRAGLLRLGHYALLTAISVGLMRLGYAGYNLMMANES